GLDLACALCEELCRWCLGERLERIPDLRAHAKWLSAGRENGQARAVLEEPGDVGSDAHHLLEVVEDEEQLAVAQVLRDRTRHVGRRDRRTPRLSASARPCGYRFERGRSRRQSSPPGRP